MAGSGHYERPATLTRALELLAGGPARVLAGGTDLYPATGDHSLSGDIVDLTGIADLSRIDAGAAGMRIGACVTWAMLARASLPPALDALAQAAREVGGRQIQNAGTIGGNLCNASPAADGVPPLLVLEAIAELTGTDGTRLVPLAEFLTGPRRTALGPGELLTGIRVPRRAMRGRSVFRKLGARRHLVISIASVAVRLVEREGRIADVAVAVGACSAVARRLITVEAALRDQPLAGAGARIADDLVAAALSPLDDIRASADYRGRAAAELIRRAVADLAGVGDG